MSLITERGVVVTDIRPAQQVSIDKVGSEVVGKVEPANKNVLLPAQVDVGKKRPLENPRNSESRIPPALRNTENVSDGDGEH